VEPNALLVMDEIYRPVGTAPGMVRRVLSHRWRRLTGPKTVTDPRYRLVAMGTRILLVRHGQSTWNAEGRWQGQADPPLSDLGRLQARSAATSLGALDAIFSSDLQRAMETAVIISTELGVGPVVVDPDLKERSAGAWSGLTRAEIDERYPGYLSADRHLSIGPAGGAVRRPPGWEADEDVLGRGLAALRSIAGAVGDGDVLAVTHGGLIYVLEAHLGAPFDRLANGGGRWVTVDGDRAALGDRVILVDEAVAPATRSNQL
jgi:probable phosphoglycerate mutase